jgi:hypothetical protein
VKKKALTLRGRRPRSAGFWFWRNSWLSTMPTAVVTQFVSFLRPGIKRTRKIGYRQVKSGGLPPNVLAGITATAFTQPGIRRGKRLGMRLVQAQGMPGTPASLTIVMSQSMVRRGRRIGGRWIQSADVGV